MPPMAEPRWSAWLRGKSANVALKPAAPIRFPTTDCLKLAPPCALPMAESARPCAARALPTSPCCSPLSAIKSAVPGAPRPPARGKPGPKALIPFATERKERPGGPAFTPARLVANCVRANCQPGPPGEPTAAEQRRSARTRCERARAPGAERRAIGTGGAIAVAGAIGAIGPAGDHWAALRREGVLAGHAREPEELLQERLRQLLEHPLALRALVDVAGVHRHVRPTERQSARHKERETNAWHAPSSDTTIAYLRQSIYQPLNDVAMETLHTSRTWLHRARSRPVRVGLFSLYL